MNHLRFHKLNEVSMVFPVIIKIMILFLIPVIILMMTAKTVETPKSRLKKINFSFILLEIKYLKNYFLYNLLKSVIFSDNNHIFTTLCHIQGQNN